MPVRKNVIDAIGNTPLIRLQPRLEVDRLRDPRQGRVHEPGPVGEGPRRARHHPRRRGARPAEARRHDRRGHGRQYRHRPGHGRQGARLPHGDRHPRDPEPGEEGRLRLLRRRPRRGAGGPLLRPDELRAATPAGWRRSCARRSPAGAVWANQFDNVANRRGPRPDAPGPEIWDQTGGKVDGFICAGRAPAARSRASPMALQGARPRTCRSALADPHRRGALQLLHRRRAEGRGHLDHRGHRPGPHHRQSGRRDDRPSPTGSPTRRCCWPSSTSSSTRAW